MVAIRPRLQLSAALALGCVPDGLDETGAPQVDCPSAWTGHDGDVWLQPGACLAWSPRAEEPMDWYAAASPASAAAGGCSAHCVEEPGWCDALAGLGGIGGWRLPALAELETAARATPPLTPLDGYLWSRDSSPQQEDMAWQLAMDDPQQQLLAGKEQEGWARCVADLRR